MPCSRRRFLQSLSGLAAAAVAPGLLAAAPLTPSQTSGPFYPVEFPLDDDNDLVQVKGRDRQAQGEIAELSGRLLDRNGRPLAGTRIEIWQCDANGRYRHPRDPNNSPIDPGFQGFGHAVSDQQGRYRFRTIRPVAYPGRTPHIHVAVHPEFETPFVTQLYVEGDPGNAGDFLYQRIPVEQRGLVTTAFRRGAAADSPLLADWDLVLGVSVA